MSIKQKVPSRKQPVVIIDKETGEQWLFPSTAMAAMALGRSRQWVSQVINDPLHMVHASKAELPLMKLLAISHGKVKLRKRGGYSNYDIKKYQVAAWRITNIGEYDDGTPCKGGKIITFSSLNKLLSFLGSEQDSNLRRQLNSLKPGDTLPVIVYSKVSGKGFEIERLNEPKFVNELIGQNFVKKISIDSNELCEIIDSKLHSDKS